MFIEKWIYLPTKTRGQTQLSFDVERNVWQWQLIFQETEVALQQDGAPFISIGRLLSFSTNIFKNVGFCGFQTGCGAHPASYPMGTGDSLPGSKAAEAW